MPRVKVFKRLPAQEQNSANQQSFDVEEDPGDAGIYPKTLYWLLSCRRRQCLPSHGNPCAREGATLNEINGKLYLFGGISNDLQSDIHSFDPRNA